VGLLNFSFFRELLPFPVAIPAAARVACPAGSLRGPDLSNDRRLRKLNSSPSALARGSRRDPFYILHPESLHPARQIQQTGVQCLQED